MYVREEVRNETQAEMQQSSRREVPAGSGVPASAFRAMSHRCGQGVQKGN